MKKLFAALFGAFALFGAGMAAADCPTNLSISLCHGCPAILKMSSPA